MQTATSASMVPTVRELRHRAEVPTLVGAGVLTMIGLIVAASAAAGGVDVPGWASAATIGLLAPVLAAVVFIRFLYWQQIANSVEITSEQLPEIHAAYVDMAERMQAGGR